MPTNNQMSSQSNRTALQTISKEPAPRWDDNWILIRNLWPDWHPTDDQVAEIWCRSFDKPHAVKGPDTINQHALKKAILDANRSSKWREPNFLDISDAYRREKNQLLAELDRLSMQSAEAQEQVSLNADYQKRIAKFESWPTERLKIALQLVGKRFPTYANKSMNTQGWSRMLAGLVEAADNELNSLE